MQFLLLYLLVLFAINPISSGGEVHTARTTGLQFQLDEARNQITSLKKMIAQLQDQLKAEITAHNLDNDECKRVLAELQPKKTQPQEEWKQRYEKCNERFIDNEHELDRLKKQYEAVKTELQKTQRLYNHAQDQLRECSQQGAPSQGNWETKYKKCAAILQEAQANAVASEDAARLTKNLETTQLAYDRMKKKLAAFKKKYASDQNSWERELNFQTQKSTTLQKELNILKSKYNAVQKDYDQCNEALGEYTHR